MGEYAEMAIEQGLFSEDFYDDEWDDDHYDDSDFTPCSPRAKDYHYCVHSIIRETEKAVLILFGNELGKRAGMPWSHAFWFPRSQIEFYECLDNKKQMVIVPKWLIDMQFSQGGVRQLETPTQGK